MAISKIQYDDKVAINIDSTIPDINKCNASDLNEIKSVVNNNADEIPTISDEYGTSTTDGYSQNYINENTINPSGEPSTSEEDVSSATFTNTLEAPMNIDLKGNTLQNGTPTPSSPIPINNVSGDNDIVVCGKNLWRFLSTDYYNNQNISSWNILSLDKLELTSTNGTYANVKYKLNLPNGTYTFKLGKVTNTNSNMTKKRMTLAQYIGANISVIQHIDEGNSYTINIDNSQNDFYCIEFWATYETAMINTATFEEIQIEQGNQATTYEAYNGTTYNIDLPVENLLDYSTCVIGDLSTTGEEQTSTIRIRSEYIEVQPNTYYNCSLLGGNYTFFYYTSSKTFISGGTAWYNSGTSQQTPATAKYLRIKFKNTAGTTISLSDLTNVQLEQGSKANSYTPYGTTPIELNKIGTYQDYFYKENDKWYLHKEIGKVVLNGSETGWNYQSRGNNVYRGYITVSNGSASTGREIALSNYFYAKGGLDESSGNIFINSSQVFLYTDITTIDDFKTWLSTHNTSVYYQLQTPTNTEITYTPLINQLESIKNAMSKEGTTNVNQVNNDLPFILDLSVFNDTYNGRYESLVEQIPNNDNLVNVGTYVNDNYKVNILYSHNLFDKDNANVLNAYIGTANGTIATLNNGRTIWIPIEANTTYTISKLKSARFVIATYTTQPALNVSGTNVAYDNDATSLTITSGTNDKYLAVWLFNGDVDTLTYQQIIDSLMINEGSEALPYETYVVPSINVDGEEIYSKPVVETIDISSYKTNNVNSITRAYMQKCGNIIKINIAVSNSSTTSGTALFENLPYKPSYNIELTSVNNNNQTTRCVLDTNGKLTISTAQATAYYINGIYFID